MAELFPNLLEYIHLQIQETQAKLKQDIYKEIYIKSIMVKLLREQRQRKNLKGN